ncbi:tRNA 2-selenouridine(34) synthase MnmH [Salibacterium salarium]|uniref:tRNA 2-selenouridine(34) synthase MnmH n=1 Tax=Salibacterium salarium TaxID=284579 RepID=A0A3R9QIU6_9BACI|nr:tRNA 2-selenouridine(34) synthase MnmH [Salibacterium salarium]RSL31667.1 tRNA 2-selenouridine(34) synthase MnmH [Salibacterium salarium]
MILKDKQFVDVRSPSEFEEYALPGAVNIPLFTDEQRADIGITYKNSGKDKAIQDGLKIVGPKLSEYYERMKEVEEQAEGKKIVVYCWRGGMRSGSFVSTMQMLGLDCEQLQGGIRSFRKEITSLFEEQIQSPKQYVVLAGGTGSAKTDILQDLQSEGYPVIDLEGLANHRGSAFGQIGLKRKSQKQFELDLWQRLMELKNSSYIIIEGESNRIGDVFLPEFIIKGKEKGSRIEIVLPIEQRLSIIMDTYDPWNHHEEIENAVHRIKKKLTADAREEIFHYLESKDYRNVVAALLYYYYDPRYDHAFQQYQQSPTMIESNSTLENYQKVKNYLLHCFENRELV